MKLITDNATLQRYLPNQIATVKGETALFDKITAHLEAAENWVIDTFCSVKTFNTICGYVESNPIKQIVSQLVCTEAMRLAIPSLDLVFTPNGFGVVSNNTVAAASKQRVDRLIGSMLTLRDEAIARLLPELVGASQWLNSDRARFFGASLFSDLSVVDSIANVQGSKWDKYLELRPQLIDLEDALAEEYISPELLTVLRDRQLRRTLTDEQAEVVKVIRNQVIGYLRTNTFVGRRLQDIVNYIRQRPNAFPEWHNSATAKLFSPPKFENKKKASGYFF